MDTAFPPALLKEALRAQGNLSWAASYLHRWERSWSPQKGSMGSGFGDMTEPQCRPGPCQRPPQVVHRGIVGTDKMLKGNKMLKEIRYWYLLTASFGILGTVFQNYCLQDLHGSSKQSACIFKKCLLEVNLKRLYRHRCKQTGFWGCWVLGRASRLMNPTSCLSRLIIMYFWLGWFARAVAGLSRLAAVRHQSAINLVKKHPVVYCWQGMCEEGIQGKELSWRND